MRIIYVAKHDSGGNDDEGAITYALQQLGHEVVQVQEKKARSTLYVSRGYRYWGDVMLFHHWKDYEAIEKQHPKMKKVLWCFDLIDYPQDPSLSHRCSIRREWMNSVTPLIDLGFCTDGDWIEQDTSGKLFHLPQGADERIIGLSHKHKTIPILFTGISIGGGNLRESFVKELRHRYGTAFRHYSKGVYREQLKALIGQAKIVVAPDHPCTNRYWSNRVYNALGFGAFLLHPRCDKLSKGLEGLHHGVELCYYNDVNDLFDQIEYYLNNEEDRSICSERAVKKIQDSHLYRHRCEVLCKTIQERLGL